MDIHSYSHSFFSFWLEHLEFRLCVYLSHSRLWPHIDCHGIRNQSTRTWYEGGAISICKADLISLPFQNGNHFVGLCRSFRRRVSSTVHTTTTSSFNFKLINALFRHQVLRIRWETRLKPIMRKRLINLC